MSRRRVTASARGGRRIPAAAIGLLALLLTGLSLITGAAPAEAHATLVSSSPQDGAEIDQAPEVVDFTFDEVVRLADDATQVIADDGQRIDLPPQTTNGGKTVEIPLRSGIPDGAYTASYRVVSEDGHVVSGAIRFGIGVQPTIQAPIATAVDPLAVVQEAAQGLVYLGIILLLGIGLITAVLWRFAEPLRRIRVLRVLGWALLALGTLARLALTGPIAAGTGLGGVVSLSGAEVTLAGIGGIAGLVRLGLLVLLLPFAFRPQIAGRSGRIVAAVLAAGLLITVALDGHPADGDDAVLATIAATGHLAAMAAWVGGLLVLLLAVLPRAGWAQAAPASLRRWSMLAFVSVVVLIVTGEYQAWRQLDPVDSLVDTAYGITLLIKVGLVACAAVAGWLAHRFVARADREGLPPTRLRRAVITEASITLAVVIVTTVLVALPPARTTYGPPTTLEAPAGDGTASITVDTTRSGIERFTIVIRDANGQPTPVQTLTGSLSSDMVAAVPLQMEQTGTGAWSAAAVVPASGQWTIQLDVDLGDAGDYSTAAVYEVW